MPTFVWKGRSVIDNMTSEEAGTTGTGNRKFGFFKPSGDQASESPGKGAGKSLFSFRGRGKVGSKDLAIFTRQFATMVNSGLPLVQSLEILSSQCENPRLQEIQRDITADVEAGATLADAMSKQRAAFDELFTNMVEAGEMGGVLDEILLRLAEYLEKADALKRKVKSAMTYPTVVFGVAGATTIFMLLFIIPSFANVFEQVGGQLPTPTRIVMGASNGIRDFWWLFLMIIGGGLFLFKRWYKTEEGRYRIDQLMLRIPVLGAVLRKSAIARFSRTLGTLIASGVPILTALEITSRTAGNRVIEREIIATRGSIREGETIAAPLRTSSAFPPMVVQMISVGEETGALDSMLEKIANFYDEEVNSAVESLTSIIEPVMIVVMGLLVGGMVVAMYLPLFKLAQAVSG